MPDNSIGDDISQSVLQHQIQPLKQEPESNINIDMPQEVDFNRTTMEESVNPTPCLLVKNTAFCGDPNSLVDVKQELDSEGDGYGGTFSSDQDCLFDKTMQWNMSDDIMDDGQVNDACPIEKKLYITHQRENTDVNEMCDSNSNTVADTNDSKGWTMKDSSFLCLNDFSDYHGHPIIGEAAYVSNAIDRSCECLHCVMSFSSRAELNRHMAVHSNHKAHTCSVCQKGYKRKYDLNHHMKIHIQRKEMSLVDNTLHCLGSSSLNTSLSGDNFVLPDIPQPMNSENANGDCCQNVHDERAVEIDQINTLLSNVIMKDGQYKCPFCDSVFPFLSLLKKHVVVHSKEKPHACSICNKSFKRKDDLARHAKRHVEKEVNTSSSEKDDSTEISEVVVSNDLKISTVHSVPHEITQSVKKNESNQISVLDIDIQLNKDTGDGQQFKCPICSSIFSLFSTLQEHVATHSKNKPYECLGCSKKFRIDYGLVTHVKGCVKSKETIDLPSNLICGASLLGPQLRNCFDGIDKQQTIYSESTEMDNNRSQNMQSELRNLPNDDLLTESCKNIPPCETSNLNAIISENNFILPNSQLKNSENVKADSCQNCHDSAAKDDQTNALSSCAIMEDGQYKCPSCDLVFIFVSCLRKHIVSHSKERPHACSVCNECYKRKDDLDRHARRHVDKELNTRNSKEDHSAEKSEVVESNDLDTSAVPPKINQSTKNNKSKQTSVLSKHLNKDIDDNVTSNTNIPSGCADDQQFKCPFCSSIFTLFRVLQEHIVTHSKDKPYECPVCSRKFKRSHDLLNHTKGCTRNKETDDLHSNHLPKGPHKCLDITDEKSILHAGCTEMDSSQVRSEPNDEEASKTCRTADVVNCLKDISCLSSVTEEAIMKHHSQDISKIGDRWYTCTLCTMVFPYFSHFKSHILSHSKEKPFICPKCKKCFKRKFDMIRHIRTHSHSKSKDSKGDRDGRKGRGSDCLETLFPSVDFPHEVRDNVDETHSSTIEGSRLFSESCSLPCAGMEDEPGTASIGSELVKHGTVHSKNKLHKRSICKEESKSKRDKIKHRINHLPIKETGVLGQNHDENENGADGEIIVESSSVDYVDFLSQSAENLSYPANSLLFSTEVIGRPFRCSICLLSFRSKGSLNTHVAVHSNEKPYMCSVCSKRFKRKHDMSRHKSLHLKNGCEKDGISMFCSPVGNNGLVAISHVRLNDRQKTKTKRLSSDNQRMETIKTIFEPNQSHGDSDVLMSETEKSNGAIGQSAQDLFLLPGTQRKSLEELELDFQQTVGENKKLDLDALSNPNKNPQSEDGLDIIEQSEVAKLHVCSVCKKSYIRESDLTKHYKRIHNMVEEDGRPYLCAVCRTEFSSKGNLKRHMSTHSDEKPFACTVCDKAFKRKDDCEKHEHIHLLDKITCHVCGKIYTDKARLELHLKSHDNNFKSFQCSVCKKIWRKQSELTIHMRVHTDERPFKCAFCTKGFKTNSSLKLHSLRHKGLKGHKCSHCSQTFVSRAEMTRHENIHTREKSYMCHVCGKELGLPTSLKKHLQIHAGIKPHKCSISMCSKRFSQRHQLQAHLKSHSRTKSHKCSVCDIAFSLHRTLKNHMLSHSAEKSKIAIV